jgi:hypothetical protein
VAIYPFSTLHVTPQELVAFAQRISFYMTFFMHSAMHLVYMSSDIHRMKNVPLLNPWLAPFFVAVAARPQPITSAAQQPSR